MCELPESRIIFSTLKVFCIVVRSVLNLAPSNSWFSYNATPTASVSNS